MTLEKARIAKAQIAKLAAGDGNVVGVGLTKQGDDYAVKVNLSSRAKSNIPARVEGVAVVFEEIGPIRKQ